MWLEFLNSQNYRIAQSPSDDVCNNDGTGQATLCNIMSGAHFEGIDSFACFPAADLQNTSMSGVLHFGVFIMGSGQQIWGQPLMDWQVAGTTQL